MPVNETVLSSGGLAVLAVTHLYGISLLLLRTDRRLRTRGAAVLAFSCLTQALIYAFLRLPYIAAFYAAAVAFWLWVWWNSGGGDGMMRRLKSWARPFGKTVPQST